MTCGKPCNCSSYRDHLLSVSFGAAAMPTRRAGAIKSNQLENRWEKDMPAYKRLRDENLQPRHIDGSAEMETRATDRIEIESGHIYGQSLSLVKDVQAVVDGTRVR